MRKELIGLFAAYDFTLEESERMTQMRFRSGKIFIDVWYGKRGITIGIYDRRRQLMRYERKMSLEKIENELIKLRGASGDK